LEIAQEEALEALKKRTQQVEEFFTERQKHLHKYADRVLSLKSKWELAWSKMPKADKDGHTKFLKDEFAKIVFSEANLTKAITQATEDYVRDVNAIENALLTKVRADIQDFPECAAILSATNTDELFRTIRRDCDAVVAEHPN
jgi:prefoldin subunit 5